MNHENDYARQTDKWIEEHPDAWDLFKTFGRELAKKGKRFGFRLIVERIRWEHHFSYDEREFKICHNHTPYMARRLIQEIPELDGLIELRSVKCDVDPFSLR
jgi:hypothetical protein